MIRKIRYNGNEYRIYSDYIEVDNNNGNVFALDFTVVKYIDQNVELEDKIGCISIKVDKDIVSFANFCEALYKFQNILKMGEENATNL